MISTYDDLYSPRPLSRVPSLSGSGHEVRLALPLPTMLAEHQERKFEISELENELHKLVPSTFAESPLKQTKENLELQNGK